MPVDTLNYKRRLCFFKFKQSIRFLFSDSVLNRKHQNLLRHVRCLKSGENLNNKDFNRLYVLYLKRKLKAKRLDGSSNPIKGMNIFLFILFKNPAFKAQWDMYEKTESALSYNCGCVL
jgi:hypothetical protein